MSNYIYILFLYKPNWNKWKQWTHQKWNIFSSPYLVFHAFHMLAMVFEWFSKVSHGFVKAHKCKSMVLDGFQWFPMFLYGFNDVVDDLHNCFNMFHWISRIVIGTLCLPKVIPWLLLVFNGLWWRWLISFGFKWLSRFPTIFTGFQ